MTSTKIPQHLLLQVHEGRGQTYRRAIKFSASDFKNFVALEYEIVRYIIQQQELSFRFVEQNLVITGRHVVFDVLDVEMEGNYVVRYYFDITKTFGQYSP